MWKEIFDVSNSILLFVFKEVLRLYKNSGNVSAIEWFFVGHTDL